MLHFRTATLSDVEAIATLHAESWQQNYRGAFSDDFLDNRVFADRDRIWKQRLQTAAADQIIFVAELESTVVGFVCALYDENEQYGTLLDNLHVVSKLQGMGIGPKLMGLVAKECNKRDARLGIYLWVLEQNVAAIRFYERTGGIRKETIEEKDIGDRVVMKIRYAWPTAQDMLKGVRKKGE